MSFNLLEFNQKYDIDMHEIKLNSKNLQVGDKVKVYIFTPERKNAVKACYEIVSLDKNNIDGVLSYVDEYVYTLPDRLTFNFSNIFQFMGSLDEIYKFEENEYIRTYLEAETLTDWDGRNMKNDARALIKVGDIVRCMVSKCKYGNYDKRNLDSDGTKYGDEFESKMYFRVVEIISNKEFYGEAYNVYDFNISNDYGIFLMSHKSICEIPILWQEYDRQDDYIKMLE